jgi:hypothetical protein
MLSVFLRCVLSSSLSIKYAHLIGLEFLTIVLVCDCICTERESY